MKRNAYDISEGGNYCLSSQVLFPIPLLSSVGTILVLATFLQELWLNYRKEESQNYLQISYKE